MFLRHGCLALLYECSSRGSLAPHLLALDSFSIGFVRYPLSEQPVKISYGQSGRKLGVLTPLGSKERNGAV